MVRLCGEQAASELGPGEYNLASFLHEWQAEHKRKHGQFGKVPFQDLFLQSQATACLRIHPQHSIVLLLKARLILQNVFLIHISGRPLK